MPRHRTMLPGGGPQQADIPVGGETIEAAPSDMPPAGEGGDGSGDNNPGGDSDRVEQQARELEEVAP